MSIGFFGFEVGRGGNIPYFSVLKKINGGVGDILKDLNMKRFNVSI